MRLRLTLLCGGLILASGTLLLVVTYALITHAFPVVTSYTHSGPGSPSTSPGSVPAGITQALDERAADLHRLLAEYTVTLAVLAVLAFALGWLFAGRILTPLRRITRTARHLSAHSLHERLALHGPDDELKELGDTFDDLLARLEQAFAAQRQFIANASHELRTPLTLQSALLEATLTDPHATTATWHTTGRRVLQVRRQQEQLIEALLALARGDAGPYRDEVIDLADLVSATLTAHRRTQPGPAPHLTVALQPALIRGDPRLIERLAVNLVDNAVRHNTPHGQVEVSTATVDGQVVLAIGNTGPVITGQQIDQIFQPFRRLAPDRTGQHTGTGLGLSIVRAVATTHAATIEALPRPGGGLTITIRFARSTMPAAGQGHPPSQSGRDDRFQEEGDREQTRGRR